MSKIIEIVLCIDEDNFLPSLVTIKSILDNTKSSVRFNIMIPVNTTEKYNELLVKNNFINYCRSFEFKPSKNLINLIDRYNNYINQTNTECKKYKKEKNTFMKEKIIKEHSQITFTNVANYSRFYISEIIDDIDTYIYSDVDIVCLDDISELYEKYDIENNNFLAVPEYDNASIQRIFNFNHPFMRDKKNLINNLSFNTAIYITKNSYWKENNITKKLEEIMEENMKYELPIFKSGTRMPINILFMNNYKYIEPKWSYVPELINMKTSDEGIIHYCGARKPWKKDNIKNINPYYVNKWNFYKERVKF